MFLTLLAGCSPFQPFDLTPNPTPQVEALPELSIDVAELDFGTRSVADDGALTLVLTLENVGGGTLVVPHQIKADGDDVFSVQAPPLIELAEGESAVMPVVFDPSTDGDWNAVLQIRDQSVELFGGATAPVARVLPDQRDVGAVWVGCQEQVSLTVLNDGREPLALWELSLSGGEGWSLDGDLPESLAPGDQVTLDLWFRPTDGGPQDLGIELLTNDPAAPQITLGIGGLAMQSATHSESHTYSPGLMTDLLFVVDSGPSMSGYLADAQTQTQALFDRLDQGQVDWHASVANGESDCHSTYDAFLDSATYSPAAAGPALGYGLSPQGSGTRALLELAGATLERTDPGDCLSGFLREDADLHIVLMTQASEATSGDADQWANTLSQHAARVTVSAVIGAGGACSASPQVEALVSQTGGQQLNICDPDWSAFFAALGQVSLDQPADPQQIRLEVDAVPETIEVWAGPRRLSEWELQGGTLFVDGDAEGLEAGDEIQVVYSVAEECL
jgi:hypothetical protein